MLSFINIYKYITTVLIIIFRDILNYTLLISILEIIIINKHFILINIYKDLSLIFKIH